MIVALLAIAGRAFAEDKLQVKDFKVGAGRTAKMEIVLINPDAKYTAFETDIYLPEGLELVKQDDEYMVETSRTAESHSASVSQKTGYYKLVLSSTKNEELSGTDGTVVTLTVKANANITVGNKTGCLKKIKLASNDNTGVLIDEKTFEIEVLSHIPGDVNSDGEIDEKDVIAIAKHIMGQTPAGFDMDAADVNGDKKINAADIVALITLIKDLQKD